MKEKHLFPWLHRSPASQGAEPRKWCCQNMQRVRTANATQAAAWILNWKELRAWGETNVSKEKLWKCLRWTKAGNMRNINIKLLIEPQKRRRGRRSLHWLVRGSTDGFILLHKQRNNLISWLLAGTPAAASFTACHKEKEGPSVWTISVWSLSPLWPAGSSAAASPCSPHSGCPGRSGWGRRPRSLLWPGIGSDLKGFREIWGSCREDRMLTCRCEQRLHHQTRLCSHWKQQIWILKVFLLYPKNLDLSSCDIWNTTLTT